MFNSFTYFDWAKIDSFGSGKAVGVEANFMLVAGIAELSARLERRWLGSRFLPSYFNAFYEIERYLPIDNDSIYESFKFKEGDVLVIGTDTTYEKAENAVIAALFVLTGDRINLGDVKDE